MSLVVVPATSWLLEPAIEETVRKFSSLPFNSNCRIAARTLVRAVPMLHLGSAFR